MNKYEYLHEVEDVWIVSEISKSCAELWSLLEDLGISLDEDVFTIDRFGKLPLWQSRSVVVVRVLEGEQEVYEKDARWNRLNMRYLLATLPANAVNFFVEKVAAVADKIGLPMLYRDRIVSKVDLRKELELCIEELRSIIGEPGSKEVAAAIERTYPRR